MFVSKLVSLYSKTRHGKEKQNKGLKSVPKIRSAPAKNAQVQKNFFEQCNYSRLFSNLFSLFEVWHSLQEDWFLYGCVHLL